MGIYYEIGVRLHDLILRCLAEHMPTRIPAGGFASICGTLFGGIHPDTGRTYAVIEPELGGWGGSRVADGMPGQFSAFHGETYNCPAEVAEVRYGRDGGLSQLPTMKMEEQAYIEGGKGFALITVSDPITPG